MLQYIVLCAATAFDLECAVRHHIKAGWRLQGGVSYDSNRKEFLQAMIKE